LSYLPHFIKMGIPDPDPLPSLASTSLAPRCRGTSGCRNRPGLRKKERLVMTMSSAEKLPVLGLVVIWIVSGYFGVFGGINALVANTNTIPLLVLNVIRVWVGLSLGVVASWTLMVYYYHYHYRRK